jgi:hypothetical protein
MVICLFMIFSNTERLFAFAARGMFTPMKAILSDREIATIDGSRYCFLSYAGLKRNPKCGGW